MKAIAAISERYPYNSRKVYLLFDNGHKTKITATELARLIKAYGLVGCDHSDARVIRTTYTMP